MSIAPVLRASASGIARRRVQTAVVFVVLLAASASATLGLALDTSANEGFQENFAKYHGAHLAVFVGAKRVTTQELNQTTRLPQVTGSAGPYPATTVTLSTTPAAQGSTRTGPRPSTSAPPLQPLTIVGRGSAGGPLDDLTLNGGRWPTTADEILLAPYYVGFSGFPAGSTMTVRGLAGQPRLVVAGKGSSAARDEGGWMTPGGIAALVAAGAPAEQEMLYTFRSAATAVEMNADLKAIEAALPEGAVVRSVSWLLTADQLGGVQGINTPFVLAFALLAIVLAALITAAVVSGVVVAGYRRIGVLKSIGFTPAQISAAYLLQVLVPAVLGCAVGAALGRAWVFPMIDAGASLFRVAITVPVWVTVAAPAAMVAIVVLAGLIPAVRAGRMSAVGAIVAGQAPAASAGHRAQRAFARLPAPRPVTLGLAAPFSRPGRSVLTAAVLCSGVAAVVLATGLSSSVTTFATLPLTGEGQAQVTLAAGGAGLGPFSARQQAAVSSALAALPGTEHSVAGLTVMDGLLTASSGLSVPGLQFPLLARVYHGDSGWLQGTLTAGTWYHQTGQVDVNHEFLTQTGLAIGDALTLSADGHLVRTTIVGEVFEAGPAELFAGAGTFAGQPLATTITQYDIGLRPGTDAAAYLKALTRRLGSSAYAVTGPLTINADGLRNVDTSLILRLTILVAALAALGVLNAMIMVVRERVHDLGVAKAIGMTPRQTVSMVLLWAVAPSVGAAVFGVPAALGLHDLTIHVIGSQTDIGVPAALVDVYRVVELALLALTSLGLAALGSLGPAVRAAVSRTTTALRAE
jgi:putative ABC transport system permease protein